MSHPFLSRNIEGGKCPGRCEADPCERLLRVTGGVDAAVEVVSAVLSRIHQSAAPGHNGAPYAFMGCYPTAAVAAAAAPAPAGASPAPRQWSQPQMPQPAVASQPPPPNQTAEEHGDSDEEEFDYGD
eukprot:COSAG01_NODE_3847_length_5644_cov_25.352209_4_plen_127_part_00